MAHTSDREPVIPRKKVKEIDLQFPLTTVKPLHAKWLVAYCNEVTSQTKLADQSL